MVPMANSSGLAGSSSARPYRGVEAAERLADRRRRLLAAGLDILGSEQQDISALTVRAVCRDAGLASRYFYESFADKDEFIAGVFDWVIAKLAVSTQATVASYPAHEKARAGMAKVVQIIAEDARIGRILFSTHLADPVIVRKRAESTALFAMLSGQLAVDALHAPANDALKAAAHFVVGGVGQTISAWLAGDLHLPPEDLVELLAAVVGGLSEPARLLSGATGDLAGKLTAELTEDPTEDLTEEEVVAIAASRDARATDASG